MWSWSPIWLRSWDVGGWAVPLAKGLNGFFRVTSFFMARLCQKCTHYDWSGCVLCPVQPGVRKIDSRVWVCKTDSRRFYFLLSVFFLSSLQCGFPFCFIYTTSWMLMTWEYNRQVTFNGNLWPQLPECPLILNCDPGTKSFYSCLFLNTKSWKHWSFQFLTSFLTLPLP